MDWFKLKVSDVLFKYDDLSDNEFGALLRAMALTATLEHIPNEKKLKKYIHYKTLKSLQEKLNECSTNLQRVLNEVSMDAQMVNDKRDKDKLKKRQQREKMSLDSENVPGDVPDHCPEDVPPHARLEKRREEKRREDKNNTPIPSLSDFPKENCVSACSDPLNFSPKCENELETTLVTAQSRQLFREIYHERWDRKKRGKLQEALSAFKANVDTANLRELEDLKTAFSQYCETDQVERSVVMKVSTWLEQWRNYLPENNEKETKNETV